MMSVGTSALLHWTSPAISDEEFEQIVARNPDLCFERTAEGDLLVTPRTDGGRRNAALTYMLMNWNQREGKGIVFDSSTGFKLPDSAIRSPDASWIANARWNALTDRQRETYSPLCPDVAIELISHTDNRRLAGERIEAFRKNGAALVVLIDPLARVLEINGKTKPWQPIELAFPGCDTPFVLDPAALE